MSSSVADTNVRIPSFLLPEIPKYVLLQSPVPYRRPQSRKSSRSDEDGSGTSTTVNSVKSYSPSDSEDSDVDDLMPLSFSPLTTAKTDRSRESTTEVFRRIDLPPIITTPPNTAHDTGNVFDWPSTLGSPDALSPPQEERDINPLSSGLSKTLWSSSQASTRPSGLTLQSLRPSHLTTSASMTSPSGLMTSPKAPQSFALLRSASMQVPGRGDEAEPIGGSLRPRHRHLSDGRGPLTAGHMDVLIERLKPLMIPSVPEHERSYSSDSSGGSSDHVNNNTKPTPEVRSKTPTKEEAFSKTLRKLQSDLRGLREADRQIFQQLLHAHTLLLDLYSSQSWRDSADSLASSDLNECSLSYDALTFRQAAISPGPDMNFGLSRSTSYQCAPARQHHHYNTMWK